MKLLQEVIFLTFIAFEGFFCTVQGSPVPVITKYGTKTGVPHFDNAAPLNATDKIYFDWIIS